MYIDINPVISMGGFGCLTVMGNLIYCLQLCFLFLGRMCSLNYAVECNQSFIKNGQMVKVQQL